MNSRDQTEVMRFLADPATHGGRRVQRLDTHISAIFLAGRQAWKIKKSVTLPFLDFSTLTARQTACQQEVTINRRTAPDLYLGTIPVTRQADGGLALNGGGEVVEWLVHMRRFAQTALLTRQLHRGKVDRHMAQSLAAAVWDLHRQAAPSPDWGGEAGLAHTIRTNAATMAELNEFLDADQARHLADRSHARLAQLAPQLEDRRKTGRVRWCHGDLHCGNICIIGGRPLLFDGIEFCQDFACVDTFYDLSFLLMDLHLGGYGTIASHVMNHYLDLSGDYQGVGLLPLFLSLRAAIRSHVLAATARGQTGRRQRASRQQAQHHLTAAQAYLSPPPARFIAVGGLSGSGKSRMARELAPLLGIPGAAVVRTDALRKQIWGCGLLDRLPPDAYTPQMTRRTYDALFDTCLSLLRAGHTVIADGVFAQPDQRRQLRDLARQAAVPFDGLWLDLAADLAAQRISTRQANISDATVAVLQQQLTYDLGHIDWVRIDSGGSKEQALARGRACLGLDQSQRILP